MNVTASVLCKCGGTFANGAVTSAFSYALNQAAQDLEQKYDVNKAIERLNANAKETTQGKCARYVREAIEAGGAELQRTQYAKDYGPSLQAAGFDQLSADGYVAQAGDVAVIQPPTVNGSGHMQMYNGNQWVSDFAQRTFYPGASYRVTQPTYEIYRP